MIINGIQIRSKEQFEEVILLFSDESKTALRLIFDDAEKNGLIL